MARAVAVVSLPVIWSVHGPNVVALLTVAAILGLLGALFDPNLVALVPDFVAPDEVQQVSGLMDLMGRIARVAGPASAGVLPEVQLYVIDAATFAVSAAALGILARMVNAPAWTEHHPGPDRVTDRAASGDRRPVRMLLRVYPATGCMIGVHAAGQLLSSVTLVLPVLLATRLHADASGYAAASVAVGLGALMANAVAGNARWAAASPGGYCLAWMASGVVLASTGAVTSLWQLLVLSVLSGAVSPFVSIGLKTHLARFDRTARLPLMSLDQTVLRAAGLAGTAALPALATGSPAAGYVLAGLGLTAVTACGWVAAVMLPVRAPAGAVERQPVGV